MGLQRQKFQRGWVTKKSGAWLGHWNEYVLDPQTGKTKRKSKAVVLGRISEMQKTKAAAELLKHIESELGLRPDSKTTVAWFIKHRWQPMREGRWREGTKATNEYQLNLITQRFGQTPLEQMDSVEMQLWINELAKSMSADVTKHIRIFLRSIMLEAMEQDYVRKNPARQLTVPIGLKRTAKTYLSIEQIKALLKAALYIRDKVLLKLMFTTGMRPSELFALRWKSFLPDNETLLLTETIYRGKLRPFTKTTEEGETENVSLVVPPTVSSALAEWQYRSEHNKENDFIFPASNGNFWWKENYQRRVLEPIASRAGIEEINFQIIRRTVATHAQKFGSLKDISAILRHKSPETAQRVYIQKIDETVRTAVKSLAASMGL